VRGREVVCECEREEDMKKAPQMVKEINCSLSTYLERKTPLKKTILSHEKAHGFSIIGATHGTKRETH
jgi:hypothetical protein